jgi:hypothetical protein
MKRVRLTAFALGAALSGMMAVRAHGQSSFEDALAQYNAETVRGYIQPLVDLFGANLNAGFFWGPAAPRNKLTFGLSLVGMASPISEKHKTYTARTPPGWSPQTFETATIFGGQGTTVTNANNPLLQYRGSDGLIDASFMPFVTPQLAVGSIAGTEAVFRYGRTPTFGDNDEIPSATLFAIGARHNVGRYLGILPIDLGLGVMYSTFTVGDIAKVTGVTIGLQGSRTFTLLTAYGTVAWEHTTMNLTYTSTDPGASGSVDVDIDGANTFRTNVGLSLRLAAMRLFADINVGSVLHYSGGLSFGL